METTHFETSKIPTFEGQIANGPYQCTQYKIN